METIKTTKKRTYRKKNSDVELNTTGFKIKNVTIPILVIVMLGLIVIVFLRNFNKTTTTTTNPDGSVTETSSMTLRQKH